MASAVASLSPVSIQTSRPSACSSRTASRDSGLSVSATAMMPAASPSTATNMGVLPCVASAAARSPRPFRSMLVLGHQPGVADQQFAAFDSGRDAHARQRA